MKKKQEEPDLKPLWGLKDNPSVHISKQKRIFETVNRLIHRIRNDERTSYDQTPVSNLLENALITERRYDHYL